MKIPLKIEFDVRYILKEEQHHNALAFRPQMKLENVVLPAWYLEVLGGIYVHLPTDLSTVSTARGEGSGEVTLLLPALV